MSFKATQDAIETLFSTQWAVAAPTVTVAYDGDGFDPGQIPEFLRFAVREATDGIQASCGTTNVLFRYFGTVFIQIFTPNQNGPGRALELADLVTPIFRSKIVNGIHYGVPVVTRVGPSDAWYQVNVSCKFYREEIEPWV